LEIRTILQDDRNYPSLLKDRLGSAAPEAIYALGNLSILKNKMVGLICSVKCPGSIVLKTFDLIRKLRDAGVVMIGGFHSPMEKDCLDLLLGGPQPVVICMPKRLQNIHLGPARQAFSEGRLLVISRFGEDVRQASAKQAMERNDLVAALSQIVFVPHASPNGKTWTVVKRAFDRGQKIVSFDDPANAALFSAGAVACTGNDQILEAYRFEPCALIDPDAKTSNA
jgi:predicted Rossmann fold nucleotide-binding protein DprA/Smf involved in DNA uptake